VTGPGFESPTVHRKLTKERKMPPPEGINSILTHEEQEKILFPCGHNHPTPIETADDLAKLGDIVGMLKYHAALWEALKEGEIMVAIDDTDPTGVAVGVKNGEEDALAVKFHGEYFPRVALKGPNDGSGPDEDFLEKLWERS
jgi:hypothetical protein